MPPKWCNTTEEQASLRPDAHDASVRSIVTGLWPVVWRVVSYLLVGAELSLTRIRAVACCDRVVYPISWHCTRSDRV